jgi:hypothetical protein
VKKLYQKHVTDHVDKAEIDEDIQKEYNRQREYLERSVESLKRKLHKDMELHRTDNMRIMQENVSLIKEINELRREIKAGRQAAIAGGTGAPRKSTAKMKSLGGGASMTSSMMGGGEMDVMREIEMQRNEMAKLRLDCDAKDAKIRQLEERVVDNKRPMSASRLPPMEGLETVTSGVMVGEEQPPAAAEEEVVVAAEEEAPAEEAPVEEEAPAAEAAEAAEAPEAEAPAEDESEA